MRFTYYGLNASVGRIIFSGVCMFVGAGDVWWGYGESIFGGGGIHFMGIAFTEDN
jgi:hypothetical protein